MQSFGSYAQGLPILLALSLTSISVAQALISQDFTTNPCNEGWVYSGSVGGCASEDGFITSRPGDQWQSPRFPVTPFEYYRVEFQSRSGAGKAFLAGLGVNHRTTWGRDMTSETGVLIADDYTSIHPSLDWSEGVHFTRAGANADSGFVRFQAIDAAVDISSAGVQAASRSQVRAWADTLAAARFPLHTTLPSDRLAPVPRTMHKLRTGRRTRIVLLGDSIMNDTGNSAFDVLLERLFPGSIVEAVAAVNGGAGIDKWNHPELYPDVDYNLDGAVIDQQPDLVMIGGISTPATPAGYDDIRQTIDKIRMGISTRHGYDVDIMLLTNLPLTNNNPRDISSGWYRDIDPQGTDYRSNLYRIAQEKNTGFLDMYGVWGQHAILLQDAGYDYEYFFRDGVHQNAQGKQILARALEAFFDTEPVATRPVAAGATTRPSTRRGTICDALGRSNLLSECRGAVIRGKLTVAKRRQSISD